MKKFILNILAQIEGLKEDVRETRANTVQILLLLGSRHDN